MEFQKFVTLAHEFLESLDKTPQKIDELKKVEENTARNIQTEITYLVCHRIIGASTGYYTVYSLSLTKEKGGKTYMIDYEPTERTNMYGETARNEGHYYVLVKSYQTYSSPPRFCRTYYASNATEYFYTIIYHRFSKFQSFAGKSYLDEMGIYNDIAAAARIAKSASRFIVPVQDHTGKIVCHMQIGNEDIIFIEVLREAFRQRRIRESEQNDNA